MAPSTHDFSSFAHSQVPSEGNEMDNDTKRGIKEASSEATSNIVAKKRGRRKKATKGSSDNDISDSEESTKSPKTSKRKATPKKAKGTSKEKSIHLSDESSSDEAAPKSPKKRKVADHQRITDRDELKKLWDVEKGKEKGSYTFKIASWNVAGLRALLRKEPNALSELCRNHDIDMLCLQETKLQESHLDDPKLQIRETVLKDDGYDSYYSCSTAKKGYSGTAVFVKNHGKKRQSKKQKGIKSFFEPKSAKKDSTTATKTKNADSLLNTNLVTPTDVCYNIGKEIDAEGRVIMLEFPFASIANVYVPNAGQTLQRLKYRTDEWDKDFLSFVQDKQKETQRPIIWLGDLNVAHTALEVWNDGAKHLAKQAGVTPEERASFQAQLDSGFIDAFRALHPTAQGQYSYWSQRAGNREPNKGLRLDYFICSPELFLESSDVIARDSYILTEVAGSDHCPVVLELEIKNALY